MKKQLFNLGSNYRNKLINPYYKSYKGILSTYQLFYLEELDEKGKLTQKELTQLLDVPKQHVSLLTKYLLENKYITTEINPNDTRSYHVLITEKGSTLIHQHIDDIMASIQIKYDYLSQEQQNKIIESIHILNEFFDQL